MKVTTSRGVGLLALTVIVLAVAGPAAAYTGQRLASQAKITIEQARAIALKAHPGQITDEELEREGGGSGLRYSFDIRNGAVTHEVGVDARTGPGAREQNRRPPPRLIPFDGPLALPARAARSRQDGAIMNEATKVTLSKVPASGS